MKHGYIPIYGYQAVILQSSLHSPLHVSHTLTADTTYEMAMRLQKWMYLHMSRPTILDIRIEPITEKPDKATR